MSMLVYCLYIHFTFAFTFYIYILNFTFAFYILQFTFLGKLYVSACLYYVYSVEYRTTIAIKAGRNSIGIVQSRVVYFVELKSPNLSGLENCQRQRSRQTDREAEKQTDGEMSRLVGVQQHVVLRTQKTIQIWKSSQL